MKKLPTLLTLIFVVLALLILTGYVKVWAQAPPDISHLKLAAYITTNVPAFNVGVPTKPYQRTMRAVDDCKLTTKEQQTKVCMSVWTTEPVSGANISDVWVNCNGTAKSTGTTGTFSAKLAKGTLQKCSVDTPPGYGLRPSGAPGAEFQAAITRFTVADGHVLIVIEMLKR